MSARIRLPVCPEILTFAFAVYGILSLVSMAAMNIGAALLAFAIILTSGSAEKLKTEILKELNRPFTRFYLGLSLLLSVAVTLSLVYASFSPLGYGGQFVEVHFLKDAAKIWYLFWPFFLLVGFRRLNRDQRDQVFKSWIIAFGCLSALGVFQYFTGWPRRQPIPTETHFHATLFLGHHLSVASIFIFPFFATLDAIGMKPKSRFLYVIAFLGSLTLFFTYSRTLWIALPVGVLIWILWSLPKKKALLIVAILSVAAIGVTQIPEIKRRINIGMGISERKNLWQANLDFFRNRPLTGVGWHHNQELSGFYLMDKFQSKDVFSGHAHNNFLEMLGGTGLIGTTCWLAWCLGIFIILLRKNRTEINITRGLCCAWIVFHINGLTQVNFWEGKVEHQMAWAIFWSLL